MNLSDNSACLVLWCSLVPTLESRQKGRQSTSYHICYMCHKGERWVLSQIWQVRPVWEQKGEGKTSRGSVKQGLLGLKLGLDC